MQGTANPVTRDVTSGPGDPEAAPAAGDKVIGVAAGTAGYAADRSPSGDEWFDGEGRLRVAAAPLARPLLAMSTEARERLEWNLRSRVDDAGITYHVYQDPNGSRRAWPLDALPAVLDGDEWATIEAGVAQRAALLDAMLADLYGPRNLLREGFVPPAFLYRHRAWLAAVTRRAGDAAQGFPRLWFYAADLARGPDGRFWVMGDRTQAPSGAAYADQNRSVTQALWPGAAAALRPQSLEGGFSDWALGIRAALASLPDAPPDACAVLLSPGPLNESWFEHVHLAQRLNLQLVQGEDLVFHEGRIWLRGLERLVPVGVILRRVDDDWSDPLFLRPDSMLGVAGLLEAERRGRVRVLNALGSGLLESPGWQAFLPRIAQEWWGEPLILPGVASWWCGDPDARAFVFDSLERLVIRRIDRVAGRDPVFGAGLTPDERDRLIADIRAAPERFVAQEALALSTFPTLVSGGSLEPRHGMLRVFAGRRPGPEASPEASPASGSTDPGMGGVSGGGGVRAGVVPPGRSNVSGAGSHEPSLQSAGPQKTGPQKRNPQAAGLPSPGADSMRWRVLPTALARVAGRADSIVVSNQAGGLSKDTWVCPALRSGRSAVAVDHVGAQGSDPGEDAAPSGGPACAEGRVRAALAVPAFGAVATSLVGFEHDNLPRRVAERFYWLGRYAERLESLVRWLRLLRHRVERVPPALWVAAAHPDGADVSVGEASGSSLSDDSPVRIAVDDPGLASMLDAAAWLAGRPFSVASSNSQVDPEGLQARLLAVFGPWGGDVLRDLLERIEGNHHALRDRLSSDTLHVLQRLHEHVGLLGGVLTPAAEGPGSGQAVAAGPVAPGGRAGLVPATVGQAAVGLTEALDPSRLFRIERALASVAESLAAFAGLSHENLVHHHGWRFLDAGRRVERARNLLRLLSLSVTPADAASSQVAPSGADVDTAVRAFGDEVADAALRSGVMREAIVRFAESVAAVRLVSRGARAGDAAPGRMPEGENRGAVSAAGDHVIDRLLRDPDNPRGLLYQVERLVDHARAWPGRRGTQVGWSMLETEAEMVRVRLRAGATGAGGIITAPADALASALADIDRLHAVLEGQFLAPVPSQAVHRVPSADGASGRHEGEGTGLTMRVGAGLDGVAGATR